MPKLRSLNLVPVKNTNSQKDLLALSKLSKLENLHLPEGYFTFESDSFFKYDRGVTEGSLAHPTLEIKKESVKLLHLIGKTILGAYGIYEE